MRLTAGLAALGMVAAQASWAQLVPPLQFSGFGTVGVSASSLEDADFRSNSEQTEGVGRTASPDYGVDSVFGVQASMQWNDRWSAVMQMQSRRLSVGAQDPYFEWANIRFAVTPNLSVRGGRIVAPVFMVSDARSIGYSQTAVRLAPDVYQLAPITYVEGGDIAWRMAFDDSLLRLNALHGGVDQSLTVSGELRDYHFDLSIFSAEFERGNSLFHAGFSKVAATLKSAAIARFDAGISTAVALNIPGADTLRANIDFTDNNVDFFDLGYQYDDGRWLLQGEVISRRAESETIQNQQAAYVLAGWHRDNILPYVQISRMDSRITQSHLPALDATGYPGAVQTAAAQLNAGVAAMRLPRERWSYALGVRWDLQENVALKLQADRIEKDANRLSYFVNATPEFIAESREIHVYTATLDFIF